MRILVISSNYPSQIFPEVGTFVYKIIQQFVAQGEEIIVISPQKKNYRTKKKGGSYGKEHAIVYRPRHWSFSNIRFLKWNTYSLTSYFQSRSIKRSVKENDIKYDVVYCHFISSALLYLKAFPLSSKPVFVAVGEYRNIDIVRGYYDLESYNTSIKKIKGFIAVSPQVKNKLIQIGINEETIIVAPNATDTNHFKPAENKGVLRRELGLPENRKLIIFVGRFLHNKGPLRILEAIKDFKKEVGLIFLGAGPQKLEGENIVFQGPVPNSDVSKYMAASDLFVLPTLHEGSSNVIVEAMASGLPIISSDIPEIKVQCDQSFSILVDPLSEEEIGKAIRSIIFDDKKLTEMGARALSHSENFNIEKRALKILNFIKDKIK